MSQQGLVRISRREFLVRSASIGAGLTLALSVGTAMQERQKEDGA